MGFGSVGQGLCFALPPSLGWEPVKELARRFADVLYTAGFDTVLPYRNYERLERALLRGEVDAAWAPPIVAARVEAAGGSVVMRAVRYGSVTYRSVLVCRSHDDIDLKSLGRPGARLPLAVWVDSWSMAGYILPRYYLRAQGIDLEEAFEDECLLGSYDACFRALIDGEADLAASFAGRRGLGYVELLGDQAFRLKILAYTGKSPNDGVVLNPALEKDRAQDLVTGLRRLCDDEEKKKIVAAVFDVDDFDRPPAGTYRPLLSLI